MKLEQIQTIARKYRKKLPVSKRYDSTLYNPELMPNFKHCAWMCDEIISGNLSQDKAMRWLCFVQGCLWSRGIYNIDELKDDNRSKE